MSIYDYPARYFADDKDISDLLSEPKFTTKKLLKLARSRGVYLSPQLPKETLIEYISRLPFSWNELISLIKELETEDSEDSTTFVHINTEAEPEAVLDILKSLQETRGQLNSEVYKIDPTTDGASVAVKYRILNHRSTRALQWTDHNLAISIHRKEGGYEIRYAASTRGKEIVEKLLGKFPETKEGIERIKSISLKGITSSKQKTKFFRELVQGLKDYRVDNVQDLRFNKLVEDGDGNLVLDTKNLTAGEGGSETADKPKPDSSGAGRVKKTTLSGDSLFQTPQFHQLCKEGFFISKTVWTVIEKAKEARKIEFEAEFKNPNLCNDFCYKIRGLWLRDEDGTSFSSKTAVCDLDKRAITAAFEDATLRALEAAKQPEIKDSLDGVPNEKLITDEVKDEPMAAIGADPSNAISL